MRISKSKFVAGVQCLKRLYFQVHQPELAAEPDAANEAIFEQGREVGLLARQMFPGGVEVDGSAGLDEAIRTTRELVANPEVPTIFEGTFENGGVLVRVDILQRRRDNRWRLLEVKSATDLKDYHLDDVAIQARVVSRSGLDLAASSLAHINRNYVFEGGSIDVRRFFKIRNLTRRIARLTPKLTFQLRAEFTVLNMPKAPDLPTGRHCTDPVTCEFFDRCNPPRPADHVGYLPRIQASSVEELGEIGVESIRDIPDDFPLNERQRRACTCVQTGEPWFSADLSKELKGLKYPLFFMDFETVNPAIPRFPGMRPYDQLPFQWSVHVLREPGAELEHPEFLATDNSDPRRGFITSLCSVLGKSGSILVYSAFESQRLSELAAWLPEFSGRIKKIQRRLWDLLPVVRNHAYHPRFAGSYSIKNVLPALVPGMTYEGMEVADGTEAGLAWESLIRGGLDQDERNRIRKALLDYCGQDTLAMVRLVEVLRSIPADAHQLTYNRGDYVKVEFPDETTGIGEWMWMTVDHCDDEKRLVYGVLDNKPVNDYERKIELGSELAVSYSQVREHRKSGEFGPH
jgi:predicted RecB family nuclease